MPRPAHEVAVTATGRLSPGGDPLGREACGP